MCFSRKSPAKTATKGSVTGALCIGKYINLHFSFVNKQNVCLKLLLQHLYHRSNRNLGKLCVEVSARDTVDRLILQEGSSSCLGIFSYLFLLLMFSSLELPLSTPPRAKIIFKTNNFRQLLKYIL